MGEGTGKIALVTGAARNLGRGIALGLASRGYDVAVHYRSSRRAAEEVARGIEALGRRAVAIRGDVTDARQVAALVARAAKALGPATVLCHGVGDFFRATVDATAPEEWDATLASNLTSAFLVSREVARRMTAGGRIIHLGFACASSVRARRGLAAYMAAKTALVSFTRSFALEVAPRGITVNVVDLGYFEHGDLTGEERAAGARVPVGRLGTIDELVAVVAFLASEGAAYLTGNALELTGGFGL
jgi:3-oxoacyl-[acyl-carrier protein] reductase